MTPPCLAIALLLAATSSAIAQQLPPPSRTVFRCEAQGQVFYSDAPCLGAKKVDVQPSRGLNKDTGKERIGDDVRRETMDENMAKAMRPIFNESAEERAKRHRRAKLKPEARIECARLDHDLARQEAAEMNAASSEQVGIEAMLLRLRMRYQELKC